MKFKKGDYAIVTSPDEGYEELAELIVIIDREYNGKTDQGYLADVLYGPPKGMAYIGRILDGWYFSERELSPYLLEEDIEDLL